MQLVTFVGFLLLLTFSLPIIILLFSLINCIHDETPRTDKIYRWTEELEQSARRLKLQYVSDENIADRASTITTEEVAVSRDWTDSTEVDPTSEPKLPFGRYEPPQYTFKELSSLGLELWTKRMRAKQESFTIDKRGEFLYKEAIHELDQVGLSIVEKQETTTGMIYIAGINASGFDNTLQERVIVKVRIYGTKKSDVSVVELSVFSRNEEQVMTFSEQLKQALWQ